MRIHLTTQILSPFFSAFFVKENYFFLNKLITFEVIYRFLKEKNENMKKKIIKNYKSETILNSFSTKLVLITDFF